jgi:hypothetical protein
MNSFSSVFAIVVALLFSGENLTLKLDFSTEIYSHDLTFNLVLASANARTSHQLLLASMHDVCLTTAYLYLSISRACSKCLPDGWQAADQGIWPAHGGGGAVLRGG